MALKGSAVIELTNPDGSKEVIKHDNMITNAASDFLKSYRGEMPPIMKMTSYGDSYMKTLFGGLFLFDETLNNDADDYFFPSLKVTGYASQDAYAGNDIARGSFSESETGLQEDGKSYKFVWDFATSQGNGTIKSLALCPNMMGKIGASYAYVDSERKDFSLKQNIFAPFQFYGYMLADNGTTAGISNYNFGIAAVIGDIAYAVNFNNIQGGTDSNFVLNNGGILKLYRFKLGANNVSVGNKIGQAYYIDCADVQLPEDFTSTLWNGKTGVSGTNYYSIALNFIQETGKLILFPCILKSDVAVHGTIKYVEIDLKNSMTVSTYTFTNNTAGTISSNGSKNSHIEGVSVFGQQCGNIWFFKDYVVNFSIVNGNKRLYVTKRSDNTQVKSLRFAQKEDTTINWTLDCRFSPLFQSGKMLVIAITASYFSSTYKPNFLIIDMEAGTFLQTNIAWMTMPNDLDIGSKVIYMTSGHRLTYMQAVNPFVLTTKNNLDSPVTKTSSQTMKITYTLTESEG